MARTGHAARSLLAALLVASAPAPSEAVDPPPGVVSMAVREALAWTPERMSRAVPYPMPRLTGPPSPGTAAEPLRARTPRVSPPSPDGSVTATPGLRSSPAEPGGGRTLGYGYPPPYTSFEEWGALRGFPKRVIGRLFFTQRGIDFVCSGAVAFDNVVWTAGHCVHDGSGSESGSSSSVLFVPGYRNGDAPFGVWIGKALRTTAEWFSSGDLRYDFGAVVIKANDGRKIGNVIGWLGFAVDLAREQHWHIAGYPAAPPFTGGSLWTCAASHATDDATMASPEPVGAGCDQTGGASGGPWVVQHARIGGLINGNSSYLYVGQEEQLYSPYFGPEAAAVFCSAAGFRPDGCS